MRIFYNSIKHVLSIHCSGLFLLFTFRLALFIAGHSFLSEESEGDILLQAKAFIRGVWFDNVIACYILALPLLAITICSACNYGGRKLIIPITRWMQVLWPITFAISAGNIPFFLYFFKNINSSIWNWAEYGTTTLGLMFGEPSYYPPIAMFFVILGLFIYLTNRLAKHYIRQAESIEKETRIGLRVGSVVIGLACIGLCIFGIRGRTGYNPIKVSAAYYCEDPFLNQLGISPSFNLLSSTLDDSRPERRELHLMDAQEAIANTQRYLGREGNEQSPLYYELHSDSAKIQTKPNVVVIMMESMSAKLMSSFGSEKELTPFLDSLFNQSIAFTNCYSAGIHTNHGIYASLYSFPAIMFRNLMKGTTIPNYTGLPSVLHNNGYRNLFFMTHESQYDNMNAFFRTNGYDEIYSQEDYPSDKVVNSFGVPDDFLLTYALNKLNETQQPFFANMLTISNHPPYVIPEWFKAKSEDPADQIVEYADHSIKMFFEEAKKQPWFENTVFVLEADHGKLIGAAENEMPESYNHIPLMIYSPMLEPMKYEGWTQQMDIQPTLLSLIGIDTPQANFGVNVLENRRKYAYYTADNVIGVRSEERLYIYQPSTQQENYYLEGKSMAESDSTFEDMKLYLYSHLQAAEQIVKEGKTTLK